MYRTAMRSSSWVLFMPCILMILLEGEHLREKERTGFTTRKIVRHGVFTSECLVYISDRPL